MRLLGKNSLVYWLKYPFAIYTFGFTLMSIWILILMGTFSVTAKTNRFVSIDNWQGNNNYQTKTEIVQFHYPFSKMVLATENSTEGILLAFIGLASISFILIIVLKIIIELSRDNFFTEKAVENFKTLGYGLLSFGVIHLAIDLFIESKKFDLTPPFFLIVTGLIFIFLKEIFSKGKKMQEENDLTI